MTTARPDVNHNLAFLHPSAPFHEISRAVMSVTFIPVGPVWPFLRTQSDLYIGAFGRGGSGPSKRSRSSDSAYLSHHIPIGYAYLQTGRYDRAIRSLQACLIATPDNAAVYGYLGDACSPRICGTSNKK